MTTPDEAYAGGARPFAATAGSTATAPVGGSVGAASSTGQGQAPVAAASSGGSPAGSSATAPRPASAPQRTMSSGPRRVRLTVARVDPWSVMKLSFLLAVAVGIAFVVMVGVLWTTLDSMGIFASVNTTIGDILGDAGQFNLLDYIGFTRVISLATVIAVVDVFLLTALATLGAFLYNVCSSLVGGLHVTLTDD